MGLWRKGRRSRLKPCGRKACEFDSHQPHQYALLAQLEERLFCNQDVAGSIPAGGTKE